MNLLNLIGQKAFDDPSTFLSYQLIHQGLMVKTKRLIYYFLNGLLSQNRKRVLRKRVYGSGQNPGVSTVALCKVFQQRKVFRTELLVSPKKGHGAVSAQ